MRRRTIDWLVDLRWKAVTPHTAPDGYGGWWVSVYDPKKLDTARATPKELAEITSPRKPAAAEPDRPRDTTATTDASAPRSASRRDDDRWLAWTLEDLERARKQREAEEAHRQREQASATTTGGSGGSVYVRGYYRKDGTYVRGHTRRR